MTERKPVRTTTMNRLLAKTDLTPDHFSVEAFEDINLMTTLSRPNLPIEAVTNIMVVVRKNTPVLSTPNVLATNTLTANAITAPIPFSTNAMADPLAISRK